MNKLLYTILLTAASVPAASADVPAGLTVDSLSYERSENHLLVSMVVDARQMEVGSCGQITVTPVISAGARSLTLPPFAICGRSKYILDRRRETTMQLHRSGKDARFPYSATIDYEDWMKSADLSLTTRETGCANAEVSEGRRDLARFDFRPKGFNPEAVVLMAAEEEVKHRSVKKSAYIEFPVNRYAIEPLYRSNGSELDSIKNTINIVKSDRDATIASISIEGFASPEGPYGNNERLARERTKSLAEYVRRLYSFPESLMTTSWTAENWEGLCRWLEANPGESWSAPILRLAKGDLKPDVKEYEIQHRYPEGYGYLLKNVFPALRRSDYRIDYTIRPYADVAEIAEVMRTNPSKLSLYELYRYANSLEPGSDDYREVFEVAVRLYPDNETANVNAASTALKYGNLTKAAGYLAKVGDSPEAVYLRGVLAAKQGDTASARALFESLKGMTAVRDLSREADEAISLLE